MRVLVVTGIWPPDVGGPATHAPDVADALIERGHDVVVLTTAVRPPAERAYPVRWVSRALPPPLRHAAVAACVARLSARADVVYAASMVGRSAFAVRAPLVIKVSGDAAYERSLRRGLYRGSLREFQTARLGLRATGLRRWRTITARRAARLVCPSEFLRSIVVGWGISPERIRVVPNAMPPVPALPARAELRRRFGVDGKTVAFAGRLTPVKELGLLFDAVDRLSGVTLLVAGEGELRSQLEARASSAVRFLGALPRERVLELLAAADVVALSSSSETFSHVLVEALAVGTPVVATEVGGVPEIVRPGENGQLVPAGDAAALSAGLQAALEDDHLRANAASSVRRFGRNAVFDQLETLLREVVET